MRNFWTVLMLVASMAFLSHCGGKNKQQRIAPELADSNSNCIAGTYVGEADIRWNLSPVDQDVNMSVAFQGSSALFKLEGEDGDLLCTRYDGIQPETLTEEEGTTVLTATKITSSRNEGKLLLGIGTGLAQSLNNSIKITSGEESQPCLFEVGSVAVNGAKNNSAINSQSFKKTDLAADFDTLLNECGGVEKFDFTLPEPEKPAPSIFDLFGDDEEQVAE